MRVLIIIGAIFFSNCSLASDEKLTSKEGYALLYEWLENNGEYRLAELSDCNCLETIKRTKVVIGAKYNPYTISGNFDDDKKIDFAFIVVNKNLPTDFLILVFSTLISQEGKPLVYGNIFGDSLVSLGLFKNKSISDKETLLLGAFGSEAEPIHLPLKVPK